MYNFIMNRNEPKSQTLSELKAKKLDNGQSEDMLSAQSCAQGRNAHPHALSTRSQSIDRIRWPVLGRAILAHKKEQ